MRMCEKSFVFVIINADKQVKEIVVLIIIVQIIIPSIKNSLINRFYLRIW